MGHRILFLSFSLKIPYTGLMIDEKPVLGHILRILVVLFGRLFPKTLGFTHARIRNNRVNFMKVSSKLQPVSCFLIHRHTYNEGSSCVQRGKAPKSTQSPNSTRRATLSRERQYWRIRWMAHFKELETTIILIGHMTHLTKYFPSKSKKMWISFCWYSIFKVKVKDSFSLGQIEKNY